MKNLNNYEKVTRNNENYQQVFPKKRNENGNGNDEEFEDLSNKSLSM